jgi:chloramphenicol-sensitive protein RarD
LFRAKRAHNFPPVPAHQRDPHREQRLGIVYSLMAFGLWGVFPLYWPLLKPAPAMEILAQRIVWSLLVVGAALALRGGLAQIRALDRRRLLLVTVASLLIGCNWGTYIWGVNHAHVVETALGYFTTPLVTVFLGVVVLGERLRPAQWVALGLSAVAVLVLTFDYGRFPWIAGTLAVSFALYGFVKKRAGVDPLTSIGIETAVLVVPALAYLAFLGGGTFFSGGTTHALLLASSGLVTAVPLVFFGAGANRVPLSILGPLQYVAPTLQFLCGVVLLHEPMAASRWVGFTLVWLGLAILTADALLPRRVSFGASVRGRQPTAELD